MLKTYFTIAYRNFIRNKIFSAINVVGLSIGISASLVIFLIVHYDFTFDKFERDRTQIYRVVTDMNFFGSIINNPGVPSPLAEAVKKEVAGVREVISFHEMMGDDKVTIPKKNSEKSFVIKRQKGIILADASYFNLISYEWIAGNAKTALTEPYKVVLSAERAKLYFPDLPLSAVIGKQVTYNDSLQMTVTGIVKDLTLNTDFIYKEFISQATIVASKGLEGNYSWTNWNSVNGSSQLFLRLAPGASPKKIEAGIQLLEKKYHTGEDPGSTRNMRLQPLEDLHFNPVYGNFGDHVASKPVLYGLLAVGSFLLILACINFINLTTALSAQRAKEIGVRKTLGSSVNQLMFQFLTETLFISFVSLILSILITPVLLKVFADFIPAGLHFDPVNQPYLILFGLLLTLFVALLAGFYPALVLSRFKPVLVLKNQAYSGSSGSRKAVLRKSLTIAQFLIAQVFTMATLIAVKQIHFVMNKNMGFKKEAIVLFDIPYYQESSSAGGKRMLLLNEVKSLPGVELASLGSDAPSSQNWNSIDLKYKDGKKEIKTDVRFKYGDTNYLKLYHIPLLAGRNIKASDTTNELVINETYLHVLGFQKPSEAINKIVENTPIVGVMSDFNQESLHAPVKPMAFAADKGNSWVMFISLKSGTEAWKQTIAAIKNKYQENYPGEDFTYTFLDEDIAKFYKAEQNMSGLLTWATGLAIFISCMGLLGLVIYTTTHRRKEIGVRKVLGASITQIVSILSKDFVKLVLIASLIAVPLSWWAMNKWLNNFAYKTPVSWWVFAMSILLMMLMALVTLSIQTFRAASANPVDSLRDE